MTFDDFTRISDNEYRFHTRNEAQTYEQEVIIRSNLGISKDTSYDVAHSIALQIMKDKKKLTDEGKIYFKVQNKVYKLNANYARLQRVAAFINTFFKNAHLNYKKVFRLEEKRWFDKILDFIFRRKTPVVELSTASASTPDEKRLLLDLHTKKSFEDFASKSLFSDDFSTLADKAFQKHESIFNIRDNSKDPDPDYIFTLNDKNEIALIPKHLHSKNNQNVKQALRIYKNYVEDLYGAAKIRYIETLYGFNLAQLLTENRPLTPEIVYRINIGVGNIEINDLQQFYNKVGHLKEFVKNLDSEIPFHQVVNDNPQLCGLTFFELRGIYKRIKNDDQTEPTVGDLKDWIAYLYDTENQITKVSELPFEKFSFLMDIYKLTPEERKKQYTGKQIGETIKSAYTTADGTLLKRWIDQQELLQTFEKLWERSNPEIFYEKLCHIISKKHLAKPHPTEIYRIGSLIPAYKNQRGEMQWYKVSSMVSNGHGLVSYTLEPACEGTNLAAIKLYRSTAAKKYSLEARQSVGNDINPFNSPGYEGFELSEQYETPFFHARSIPSWVAYQNQLEKKLREIHSDRLTKEEVISIENQCAHMLDALFSSKEEDLSLGFYIRKNDAKFISLLSRATTCKSISTKDYFSLAKTLYKYSHRPVENSVEYRQEEKEAIRFILQMIAKVKGEEKEKNGSISSSFDELLDPLNRRLEYTSNKLIPSLESPLLKIQKEGERVRDWLSTLASNDNPVPIEQQNAMTALTALVKQIKNYAIEIGENIESKKNQEVTFTGHSLGGAASQLGMVTYFVNRDRVPLPGKNVNIRVFDDPAINAADNQAFIAYGNRHSSLLNEQNSRVMIVRRQEKGDFVPIAGEEHLGAVFSEEEESRVKKWMGFDAAVQGATKTATDENIIHSLTAHATQFESGKRHSEWIYSRAKEQVKKHADNSILSDMMSHLKPRGILRGQGDYHRTWFTPVVQGIFDGGSKSKHWKQLKHIWDLPLRVDPGYADTKRKQLGLMLRMELLMSFTRNQQDNQNEAHGDAKYRDSNDVFVVNEEGIVTKNASS